jgi:hypothetical protein
MAILYGLALLGYQSDMSGAILLGVVLACAFLAFKQLDRALLLTFIELFSNPHGILLSVDLDGFTLTLRMAIFVGVMTGWGIGLITRRFHLNLQDGRAHIFSLLGLAVSLGFIVGVLSRDPLAVFSDGNAYFFLLYLLPMLSVDWHARLKSDLLQSLAAGALWISGLSMLLLYIFTHFGESVLQATYYFFRDLRVAEITSLGHGLYRVFIQSQVFVVLFGFLLASVFFFSPERRRSVLFILALLVSTILLALSSSFWVGLLPSLIVFAVLVWRQVHPTGKQMWHTARATILCGLVSICLILGVVLFPIPSQDLTGSDLVLTLKDRTTRTDDVAIRSRWKLLAPMFNAIFESPLTGQGFGASVTFVSDDPRVREIHPDGTWTTSSMEWGWLELWVKMGILGPMAFLYAAYELIKRLWAYRWTEQAWLGIAFISGLVFIYGTHFFSPYLNHPIGLGYLLFLVPFLPNKKPAESHGTVFMQELLPTKQQIPAVATSTRD